MQKDGEYVIKFDPFSACVLKRSWHHAGPCGSFHSVRNDLLCRSCVHRRPTGFQGDRLNQPHRSKFAGSICPIQLNFRWFWTDRWLYSFLVKRNRFQQLSLMVRTHSSCLNAFGMWSSEVFSWWDRWPAWLSSMVQLDGRAPSGSWLPFAVRPVRGSSAAGWIMAVHASIQ